MFTNNIYLVTIEAADTMDLVKVLGKYGVKFKVGMEYVAPYDQKHTWLRNFQIKTSDRKMAKIKSELHSIGVY